MTLRRTATSAASRAAGRPGRRVRQGRHEAERARQRERAVFDVHGADYRHGRRGTGRRSRISALSSASRGPQCPQLRSDVNGEFLPPDRAHVSVFDQGVQMGDGIYEMISGHDRKLFRLEDHLDRLDASMHATRILPRLTRDEWRAAVIETARRSGYDHVLVRIIVTRGIVQPGSWDPRNADAERLHVAHADRVPRQRGAAARRHPRQRRAPARHDARHARPAVQAHLAAAVPAREDRVGGGGLRRSRLARDRTATSRRRRSRTCSWSRTARVHAGRRCAVRHHPPHG